MTLLDSITAYEAGIRLGFFCTIFLVMATWELVAPRRKLVGNKAMRWTNNIILVVLNTLVLRLLFPTAAIGVAIVSQQNHWGILAQLNIPFWAIVTLAVVLLDFAIYQQHVMFHSLPILWRLHRVHHADIDIDLTTGSRFHPFEIILSMLIKMSVITLIGAPVIAVIIFEILLNGSAMFNHSNVHIPKTIDHWLRLFIVTPDMHRVHHSVEDYEANSNFGFNVPWWDRLFGTYTAQPSQGHLGMTIGIHKYNQPKDVCWLPGLLLLPLKGKISQYAINRRSWDSDEK